MKKVTVSVDKNLKTTVETEGFQGSGCADVIDGVQRAMAAQTVKDDKKPEFYAEICATDGVRTGQGSGW